MNSNPTSRVVIPSGSPPFLLPFGVEASEPTSLEDATMEDVQVQMDILSGTSGLLSSSAALASALGGLPEASAALSVAMGDAEVVPPTEGILPSDDQILEWGKAVQEAGVKNDDSFFTGEALAYWARYTFPAYTAEYRQVRARILSLFGSQ